VPNPSLCAGMGKKGIRAVGGGQIHLKSMYRQFRMPKPQFLHSLVKLRPFQGGQQQRMAVLREASREFQSKAAGASGDQDELRWMLYHAHSQCTETSCLSFHSGASFGHCLSNSLA
jgi:hypothetical protein